MGDTIAKNTMCIAATALAAGHKTLKMNKKWRTKRFTNTLEPTLNLLRQSERRLVANKVCTHTRPLFSSPVLSGEWLMPYWSRQHWQQRPQREPSFTIKTLQTQSFSLDCCFSAAAFSIFQFDRQYIGKYVYPDSVHSIVRERMLMKSSSTCLKMWTNLRLLVPRTHTE